MSKAQLYESQNTTMKSIFSELLLFIAGDRLELQKIEVKIRDPTAALVWMLLYFKLNTQA